MTAGKTLWTRWKASAEVEVEWVAACRSTPRSSCRCLVPRWEVVAEAGEEGVSKASVVGCQEAADEELHRASQAAAASTSSDMMRRRTSPGSSPRTTTTKGRILMWRTNCGKGRMPPTDTYRGFVNWDWGSCWLASSSHLISWLSRPLLGRECTFAYDMCCTCARG